MGDELLYVGAVNRAADIPEPNRLTEVGWGSWRTGCVPAGRLALRLPRWVGRPERMAEACDFSTVDVPRRVVSRRTVPDTPLSASLRALRASLEPGVKSGQVAFVLASFPSSFKYSVAHRLWLDRVLGALEGFPLVAGFWSSGWYTSRLIDGLKQRNVALCLYDAPHAEGVPPAVEVLTAERVYLKLLGRNDMAWEARRFAHVFDYRYTEREIAELLSRMTVWAHEASTVGLVFANGRWAGESAALLAGRIALMAETGGRREEPRACEEPGHLAEGAGGTTRRSAADVGGALDGENAQACAGEAPP